ncbi:MAG TPA: prepilin-type N-terminal cleavage/methylation domain-containing protein [Terrimicrobiaceae bacterium]
MEQRPPPRTRAFTLIELLVVIAIIAILAGLILSTAGYIQKKGAMSRAEAEIAALSVALENYKADNGDYPHGNNVAGDGMPANNGFLLSSLMPGAGKVYFEFNKSMTNAAGNVVDPFGENYGYQYPGDTDRSGTDFFDLFSRCASSDPRQWKVNW